MTLNIFEYTNYRFSRSNLSQYAQINFIRIIIQFDQITVKVNYNAFTFTKKIPNNSPSSMLLLDVCLKCLLDKKDKQQEDIAQVVEHWSRNAEAGSSTPDLAF